jgi:predicted site-specific integrase-resolvase
VTRTEQYVAYGKRPDGVPILYRPGEVATIMHLSRSGCIKWLRSGKVPGVIDLFGLTRIRSAEFDAWWKEHNSKVWRP